MYPSLQRWKVSWPTPDVAGILSVLRVRMDAVFECK
jgi:hypothetical protein